MGDAINQQAETMRELVQATLEKAREAVGAPRMGDEGGGEIRSASQ